MHRRTLLCAAALTPLALPARAERGDILQPGDSRPVQVLRSDGRLLTVQAVELGGVGLRWQGTAPVWAEDRFDLSRLSPLFRQPFAARWAGARVLGPVAHRGDLLTAPVAGGALAGRRVVVAAGGLAWDLPGVLASGGAAEGGGTLIGEARMGADGAVLIHLAAQPAV